MSSLFTTIVSAVRLGLPAGLLSLLAMPSWAISFSVGSVEAQLDSSLSFSTGWGTARPDNSVLGVAEGGRGWVSGPDGRANFGRGDTFSKRFEGWHELELRRGDSGAFISGKYWYDFELKDEQPVSDSGRRPLARSSGAELLQAYVYQHYRLMGQPGSVRLGRQTLSWGEGLFIQQGINVVNPYDLSAFHRPATALEDGLLPVSMLQFSQQLSDNLAVSGFYQLEWRQSLLENCGTFFAGNTLAEGCDTDILLGNHGEDMMRVARLSDRHARDSGQWGASLHYFLPQLETELGAYFINYHSRTPMVGGASLDTDNADAGYFAEYPEDIRLYGLSFSSMLASGTRWQGEISYRPNAPLQFNTLDMLYGHSLLPGDGSQGYERKPVTQLQTGLSHIFDGVMGAAQLTLQGELGWTHVGSLESKHEQRYGRAAAWGPSAAVCAEGAHCRNGGFTTRDAWGYRLRGVWAYHNVFPGVHLSPNLAWSHDVSGYAGEFEEGRKAVSIGVDADYRELYRASLAYTNFFGGRYSQLHDRDFLSFTLGVRF